MDVANAIIKILIDIGQPDNPQLLENPDCSLADLELDSLALLEVIYEIEERFGVTLDEKDLEQFRRVSDLARCVVTRLRDVA